MSEVSALEHGYRRLLACYPAEHRRAYAEEMVGVLLASASDGQRRPGLRDTADLIAGAVKVRLRNLVSADPDPGWRDALALTSLLAPLLLAVLLVGQDLGWMATLLWHSRNGASGFGYPIWPALVLLVPLAIALAGLRQTAVAATAALLAWITMQAAIGQLLIYPRVGAYLVLLGVQAVALARSDGPRHGLRLIAGKSVSISAATGGDFAFGTRLVLIAGRAAGLALPWLAFVAYAAGIIPSHYPVPLPVAEIVIGVLALAALPALASARGRRVIILLVAIPGSAFLASLLTFVSIQYYSFGFAASQVALYLPPIMIACLAATAIRSSGSRSGSRSSGRFSQSPGSGAA
jgi:hypothetical protein